MRSRPGQPYRRRSFFVKHAFQTRFALYPVGFLVLFLLVGGVYLHGAIREGLEYHLYSPHSRLENPWDEVWPPVVRLAAWGGAAFLAALGAWGWRRFSSLRRDLDRLGGWVSAVAQGEAPAALPAVADDEVRALARGLGGAAGDFRAWDARVEAAVTALVDAAEGSEGGDPEGRLQEVRARLTELRQVLGALQVHEELS